MSSTVSSGSTLPDLDRVFDLLSHRYRRWILTYMVKFDKQTIPVTTAVNVVTFFDPLVSRDGAHQVLVHTHLRRLDIAGIIDFDPQQQRITLLDNPLIEALTQDAMAWDPVFVAADHS